MFEKQKQMEQEEEKKEKEVPLLANHEDDPVQRSSSHESINDSMENIQELQEELKVPEIQEIK